jgi:hypothetical protein
MPYPDQRKRPIRVGSLWWPQGASRWAVGHFLATEGQLDAIRSVVYAGGVAANYSPGFASWPLVLDDGTVNAVGSTAYGVVAQMFMLPPRPIAQSVTLPSNSNILLRAVQLAKNNKWLLPQDLAKFAPPVGEPVYLLTLVDQRYFWWQRASTVTITPGVTTWQQLLAAITHNLGTPFAPSPVANPYGGTVPNTLIPFLPYLPLVFDMAAIAVGQRVVQPLSGPTQTQNAAAALAQSVVNLAAYPFDRMAGGLLAFDIG